MKQAKDLDYLEEFVAEVGAAAALISLCYDKNLPSWLNDRLIDLTLEVDRLRVDAFLGFQEGEK